MFERIPSSGLEFIWQYVFQISFPEPKSKAYIKPFLLPAPTAKPESADEQGKGMGVQPKSKSGPSGFKGIHASSA